MGVEFYLVDHRGKRVIDIHKAYWLAYSEPEVDTERVDAAAVEQAGAAMEADHAWKAWLVPLVVRWLREVATDGWARLESEYTYDEVEPWRDPDTGHAWTRYTPWDKDDGPDWRGFVWLKWPPHATTEGRE